MKNLCGIVLNVELVAGLDFERAFMNLQTMSQNLGCQVCADMNDVRVCTYPGQPMGEFLDQYRQAIKAHKELKAKEAQL